MMDNYNYMLLSRLKSDCEYAIKNQTLVHLWGHTVDGHITEMKRLYNLFNKKQKPEWISMDDINEYESMLKSIPVKSSIKI